MPLVVGGTGSTTCAALKLDDCRPSAPHLSPSRSSTPSLIRRLDQPLSTPKTIFPPSFFAPIVILFVSIARRLVPAPRPQLASRSTTASTDQ
jgi:hypothetical protein